MSRKTPSYSAARSRSWPGKYGECGVALVFVLWVMVLLSAVALEMTFRGHLRVQVTTATGDTAKTYFLARSGVEHAMADLAANADAVEEQYYLREDAEDAYQNVPMGEGTYTLYAGMDREGNPRYGMVDESSKLNINTANAETLSRVPGLDQAIAEVITKLREEEPFRDLKDLLLIEGVDQILLYGEDQNENGLLDPTEDDGNANWPPDNEDGWLDGGLSDYLTTWSVARNVTALGEERTNINQEDADAIADAVSEISLQQAESIVAHREKSQLSSVLDLLDVELVEKVAQGSSGEGERRREPNRPRGNDSNRRSEQADEEEPQDKQETEEAKEEKPQEEKEAAPQQDDEEKNAEKPQQESQMTTRGTGEKAFDEETVRKIADLVTTEEDDVRAGLVNVNTASVEVLACLPGMDESLGQAIVNERESRAGGFTTVMDLLDVDGMTMSLLKPIYQLVSVRSDSFSVRSFGVLGAEAHYTCVRAVLDRSEEIVHLRYWQELE